jgi:hypothetical protein
LETVYEGVEDERRIALHVDRRHHRGGELRGKGARDPAFHTERGQRLGEAVGDGVIRVAVA